jgi:hypothetical protein
VLEALDEPMSIGLASERCPTEQGLAVWSLSVHGADVPGRWVIGDQLFVPVKAATA